jgi:SAM-dependent methyltransferase
MTATHQLKSFLHAGRRVSCPCCGRRWRRFARVHSEADRACWNCGSLERDRLLWLFLDRHGDVVRPGMDVLHVAPERALQRRLRQLPEARYLSGDLASPLADVRLDVTELQFSDESFDLVVCNHVLEHVPDDRRAMRELHRVLRPGGVAILLVPDVRSDETFEDPSVTDPDERQRLFGQDDHVRVYGWDYLDRLRDAGFEMEVVRMAESLEPEEIEHHRLRKFGEIEPIFLGRKALT